MSKLKCGKCHFDNHVIGLDGSDYYVKKVLPLDSFKAFLCVSVSDKIAICLGEKQGMYIAFGSVEKLIFCCQFRIDESSFCIPMD